MNAAMNRPFSVYLDLVRFSAAVLVYLWHSNQRFLTEAILPISNYGHDAVIVFFVLSGFVIAYVTDTKETTLPEYAASRISRVFSVAIPAVFITLAADSIGRQLYPAIYGYPYDQFLARIAGSVLMANEVWFISITSFSNVPYWSIGYEWWYYVTFAMVMFLPSRIGILVASATLLAIGPKLILLAPIWWLGVLLYRWRGLLLLPNWASWLLVAVSVGGIAAFQQFDVMRTSEDWLRGLIGAEMTVALTFSKRFLADYLLGFLVFLHFAGMRNLLANGGRLLMACAKPIRFVAAYTFTLYLLHQPLFLFWGAVVRGDPKGLGYWTLVTALTMASIFAIGHLTETRRHVLRNWLLPRLRTWSEALSLKFGQPPRLDEQRRSR